MGRHYVRVIFVLVTLCPGNFCPGDILSYIRLVYLCVFNAAMYNSELHHFIVLLQGHLNTYRFCDNVWTFVLNKVEFRDAADIVNVEKVKIVACDGKGMK